MEQLARVLPAKTVGMPLSCVWFFTVSGVGKVAVLLSVSRRYRSEQVKDEPAPGERLKLKVKVCISKSSDHSVMLIGAGGT